MTTDTQLRRYSEAGPAASAGPARGGPRPSMRARVAREDREAAIASCRAGADPVPIARMLGIRASMVRRWAAGDRPDSAPPETRREAVAAVRTGEPVAAVAARFRVRPITINQWLHAAGRAERRAEAVDAYLAGETAGAVARRHAVSTTTVTKWVHAAGHTPRPPGRRTLGRAASRAAAVAAYLAGEPAGAVGAASGVHASTVRRWVRAAGHTTRSPAGQAARSAAVGRYREGEASAAIAAALGVNRGSVLRWVREAGHTPRKPGGRAPQTDADAAERAARREAAVERYLAGEPAAAVAAALGVRPVTVVRWVRAAGHAPRPPGRRPTGREADREAACARYRGGEPAAAVAAAYNVSAKTIRAWAGKAGPLAPGRKKGRRL